MKKVLYVHGLGSGESSRTAQVLRDCLKNVYVFAPEIPQDPEDAYKFLIEFYRENVPDVIVGSSLGGFYSSLIGGCYKVLINPALVPHKNIRDAFGISTRVYLSERSDGIKTYNLTEDFYEKLERLYNHFHEECFDEEFRYETYAIIGCNDEVIDPNRSIAFYESHYSLDHLKVSVGLKHRPREEEIRQLVVPLILKLLGE